MKLEHAFDVPASPDQTMTLLLDAERVVPCMPGATLKEVVDEDTWKAEMGVKLGPVGMQFLVDVKLLERDPQSHVVKLSVSGRDTRGKGGAEGSVDSRLTGLDGGGTRVEMVSDIRFWARRPSSGGPAWCRTCPTSWLTSSRSASRPSSRHRPSRPSRRCRRRRSRSPASP